MPGFSCFAADVAFSKSPAHPSQLHWEGSILPVQALGHHPVKALAQGWSHTFPGVSYLCTEGGHMIVNLMAGMEKGAGFL